MIGATHQAELPSQFPRAVENPVRILVADDHPIILQGLKSILDRDGFNVVGEASDGRQAVSRAHELQPDLVIMDISMRDDRHRGRC